VERELSEEFWEEEADRLVRVLLRAPSGGDEVRVKLGSASNRHVTLICFQIRQENRSRKSKGLLVLPSLEN
jgi:hypothetical protein